MFSDLEINEGSPSGLTWKDTAYSTVRGKPAGTKRPDGYWSTKIKGKQYLNHRIILQLLGVNLKDSDLVDHVDGDPSNNNGSNLRVATPSENMYNAKIRVTNTSGFKGVSAHGKGWRAQINHEGRCFSLGTFRTPEEAHLVIQQKRKELHHEFARN